MADKTRVLLRPHWLSKSPDTHQKIAPVAVVLSSVNCLLSRFKSLVRGYDGDAGFLAAYFIRDNEFSSPRTGIEKQGVVNERENTAFLPLGREGVCYTHPTPRGGDGEATSGRKKEIVADRVIFLLCTSYRKALPLRARRVLSTPVAPNWKQQSGKSRHGRLQKV